MGWFLVSRRVDKRLPLGDRIANGSLYSFKDPSQPQFSPGKAPETDRQDTDRLLFGEVRGLPYILVIHQPTKHRTPNALATYLAAVADFLKLNLLSLGDSLIQSRSTLGMLSMTLVLASPFKEWADARDLRTRLDEARRSLTVRLVRTRSLVRIFLSRTHLSPSNQSSVAIQTLPEPSGGVIERASSTRQPEPKAP